jgi:hypothetical protein
MMESYKPKNELVAITITDTGQVRKWRKGDIVTIRWTHLGRSGEGEFIVADARTRLNSSMVEIDLVPKEAG